MEVLSQEEFDVLVAAERYSGASFDAKLACSRTVMDEETFDRALAQLCRLHFVAKDEESLSVTEEGYAYLAPFRVKRAIFLAAGFGSRMLPVTLTTPKPLVSVKGTPIIETMIEAVIRAGIPEIIVVVGYLKEQFLELSRKYPQIHFVVNYNYNTENNISSAYLVRNYLDHAYVMEGDLYLSNPDLIRKYENRTNYLGVWTKETDDWCLPMENGRVTGMTLGGKNVHMLVGISYWDDRAADAFAKDIETVYATKEGKASLWDKVTLEFCNDHYDISVRDCVRSDVVEIDSTRELAEIDPFYLDQVPQEQ